MESLPNESVDLIYIDPPFFTNRKLKTNLAEFNDSWKGLEEFLEFLNKRFIQCHRILKKTGVFCLHLDYRAVHYAKVELDKIFGYDNFINEIIWCYSGPTKVSRTFLRKHDTILVFGKTENFNSNVKDIRLPFKNGSFIRQGSRGMFKKRGGGGFYKATGKASKDWWIDIPDISRASYQRQNYPTQKPLKIPGRLIKAFTNEGDLVADFFCGSGTTLAAAFELGRKYLGCDISKEAIFISRERLGALKRGRN